MKVKCKSKKIELKVVYESSFDDDGYIEIDGVKINQSNKIEFGSILDILKHLGYEVNFIKSEVKQEIQKL